jgi:hypothetical protein
MLPPAGAGQIGGGTAGSTKDLLDGVGTEVGRTSTGRAGLPAVAAGDNKYVTRVELPEWEE